MKLKTDHLTQIYKLVYLIWLSLPVIAFGAHLEETSIRKYAERAIETVKIKLHKTLDEASRRRRRSYRSNENIHQEIPAIASQKVYSSLLPVVAWCVVHLDGEEIPFAATEEEIGIFDEEFLPLIDVPNEEIIYLLLGFQYEDDLWLVTIQSDEDEHSFRVYKYSDDSLIHEEVFLLPGESFSKITKVQETIYLPILSNIGSDSILNLFRWQEIQFDSIAELPLKGNGKSLASWEMYDILFVAVSFNDFLKIYHFSGRHERLILTQLIEQDCNIVKHFEIGGDHQLVCSGRNKIVLYWWNGHRFTEQQEILDVESAVDIALINLTVDNVMIVSVKYDFLEFYFQDSGFFIKSKEVEVLEEGRLKSADVWKKSNSFYILPVYYDSSHISVIHLHINLTESQSPVIHDPSLSCALELEKALNDTNNKIRKSDLNLSNIWTKNMSSYIPEVRVNGFIFSKEMTKISRLSFADSDTFNAQYISDSINKLSTKLKSLQYKIRNVTLKSANQEIYGPVKFGNRIIAKNMNISRLTDHLQINGIHTSALTSVLKNTGSQTISRRLTFNTGVVKNVETKLLNSKVPTDYLLLSNHWEYVKGNLQFKDVSVNSMKVKSHVLNDIPLRNIVTTSSPQNIIHTKTFPRLSSTFVATDGYVSGVNMSNFKNIVLKDTAEFGMRLNFTSDVAFQNMIVRSIKGIDLSRLIFNSVKYSEDQTIQGIKTFKDSVTIEGNPFTVRYINSLKVNELMTLNTPQTHYNDFELADVSFKEIKTHSVNGVDLSQEAIQRSGDFKIDGKVNFTELVADNVVMKNGVLLNEMDLSNVVPSPTKNIFTDSLEIGNIIVKNNVEIRDTRIKSLLRSLKNDVWFKTKPQRIPYAHFKSMNVIDLNVNSLNDVAFDEIVLRNQSAVIDSVKEIIDIEAPSVSLKDGITVNNVDFTSSSLVSSFFENLKHFVVKDMLITGNLTLSTFNNIDLSDLMHVEKFQVCNGSKTFDSISVDELIASDLDFDNIYNRSFSEYVADSVSLYPEGYISNKNFYFISILGKELNISGFLNGRKFDDFRESVVTLNSYQIINSDMKFTSGLEMESAIVTNLNVPNLENIVCIDRAEKNITHKQFQKIYANEANFGVANGVRVTELQNAFLKGRDNWVPEDIIFKSDLMIRKIQILSPASIDGVKLDDALEINRAANLESMDLANIHTKNIDIFGKINGCDLSEVKEFLMKNFSVKTKKSFTNLVVDGNLHVKNVLNGLPESFFSNMDSILRSAFDIKRSFNFLNVKANQLKVVDVIDGINIDFLLKDVVRSHLPQAISGKKSFSKITTSDIFVNRLNVTFLNKLNFPLLYRKYVSKTENQMIALNLQNVTAGEVFIEGRLNGVKIPEDVVLAHSDEKISTDVIFKEPITSFSLNICKINGIDLQQFLRSVISLKSNEHISSTLTFVKEFFSKGDLHIANSLHGINLNDVVKTSDRFLQNAVKGNKGFSEEINFMRDFSITGLINGVDLENLSESLCQRNKFEFFENMVYFAGLNASSLYAANINKVSLEYLWLHILDTEKAIGDQLDNAKEFMNDVKYKLLDVKGDLNGSLSVLAYFELHQTLNVGFSLRFLPILDAGVYGEVYQLPAKEMILWINPNETCTSFKSFKFTVKSDGTLKETGRTHGRIFPFSLRVLEDDVQGFKLHVDRSTRCTDERKAVDLLKSVFTGGNDSVYALSSSSNSSVLDAKLLETEDGIFLMVAYEMKGNGERMHVYDYSPIDDTWILHQTFHSWDVSSFDTIYIDDGSEDPEGFLVITGKGATSGIYLYLWDFDKKEFIHKSVISKSVSTSALWVITDKDVFLFLAKEKSKVFKNNVWSFAYSEPVEVYVLEDDLEFCYEINIYGISSFDTFKLAGETYVLAVSPHLQTVYLLQYQGYAGFQVIQEFSAPGVVSVSVFSSGNDIYLAMASSTGHTRILKCIIRGRNFVERREIKDEAN